MLKWLKEALKAAAGTLLPFQQTDTLNVVNENGFCNIFSPFVVPPPSRRNVEELLIQDSCHAITVTDR